MPSAPPDGASIGPARAAEMPLVRTLFREYAGWLNVDLRFQKFEQELASLPGVYSPPEGEILLARIGSAGAGFPPASPGQPGTAREPASSNEVAGCVALRRLTDTACEMKRLWVRPAHRGRGLGRQLVQAVMEHGRNAGYEQMVLDTLRSMVPAYRLYRACGFAEIAPYYDNPLPDAVYLGRRL